MSMRSYLSSRLATAALLVAFGACMAASSVRAQGTPPGQKPAGECIVNLTADGRVVVNRQTLTLPELEVKLRKLSDVDPDQAVILRGDGHVEYSHVVEVMDTCRAAKIWNVAFATARPQPPS